MLVLIHIPAIFCTITLYERDVGVFASTDPVAIDKNNGKTVFRRGRYDIEYAEKLGLSGKEYELVEIK